MRQIRRLGGENDMDKDKDKDGALGVFCASVQLFLVQLNSLCFVIYFFSQRFCLWNIWKCSALCCYGYNQAMDRVVV